MLTNLLHRHFSEAYVLMFKIPYKIIAAGYLNTDLEKKETKNTPLNHIDNVKDDE